MKICRFDNITAFHEDQNSRIMEYSSLKDKDMDLSIVEMHGSSPETGYVLNQVVKELIYVLKGEGQIVQPEKTTKFKKGDALIIEMNEMYRLEGNFSAMLICVPAFTSDQHKFFSVDQQPIR